MIGPIPIRVQVPGLANGPDLFIAAWLFAPARSELRHPVTVVYAFPGGGYSKSYYHMEIPGRSGYSMATYLVGRGMIVIVCDPLATGESSRPRPPEALTWEVVADANDHAVSSTLDRLRKGELMPSHGRIDPQSVIGLGHSLGAGLVTVQQARRKAFSGLVLLGRSIGATHVPAPPDALHPEGTWRELAAQHDEVAASTLVDGYPVQSRRTEWQRYLFYWHDVPEDVIVTDTSLASTMPLEVARELAAPQGPNAKAAAAVDVPILLGFGERDVSRDPLAEPRAYRSATDISVFVLRGSGHCHNLAATRQILWSRVARWIETIAVDERPVVTS